MTAEVVSSAPIRIGVIGLGIAGAAMIPAIAAHPNVVLAAAADPNVELRERLARDHACPMMSSAEELVARGDIDAVYVATPHQLHREHVQLAANHRKHVIVEKPLALTLADCDAMIAATMRNGVALVVGHTHSFDPAIKAMREIIDRGEVGRPAMIAMWQYTDFLYRPRRPEELDTALGGGIIFNQIPHQVDIARLLNGSEVATVRASTAILDPGRPTEGMCMALMTFGDGGSASLVYSGYDRFDSDVFTDWVGELGQPKRSDGHGGTRRALEALGVAEASARAQRYGYGGVVKFAAATDERWSQPHFGTIVVSCERADLKPSLHGVTLYDRDGAREIPAPPSLGVPGRAEVLDELHLAITKGVSPVHGGAFARGTLKVCLAILESSRTRKEVELRVAGGGTAKPKNNGVEHG
jgi:phthalate 4,5-cis-dihydrodiol dehydrogenase